MKKYILPVKWYVLGTIFFIILGGVALAFLPISSKMLFDTLAGEANHSYAAIISLFVGCVVLDIAAGYGSMRMTWGSAVGFEITLKKALMRSVLLKPFNKFAEKHVGEHISFISNDIATLDTDYLPPLISMITTLVSFVIYFLVIFILVDWRIAILLLVVSVVSVMLTKLSTQTLGDTRARFLEAQGEYTEKVRDFLEGRRLVTPKTCEQILSQHDKSLQAAGNKRLMFGKRKTVALMLNGVFSYSINVAAFIFIAYLLFTGNITVGSGVAAIGYIEAFAQPLQDIMYNLTALRSVRETKRIFLAETTDTHVNKTQSISSFKDALICNNLTIRRDSFTIKSFNYTFEKGKKYALIGSNGSGKTTLLDTIAKFHETYEGSVSVDGTDIKTLDISSIITYQSQAEHVYRANYTDNTTIFGSYLNDTSALDSLVNQNIKQSKNCMELSGGERQIVSFLRTLNANSPILLLDEPFSAVDENTKKQLVPLVISLDKTILIVTHDLTPSLAMFDDVLIFENGRLSDSGAYDTIKNTKAFSNVLNSIR